LAAVGDGLDFSGDFADTYSRGTGIMSVRPIDIKTNLLVTEDASRLREAQKAHEAGQAEQVAQNRNAANQKTETVQKTEAGEGAVIRKEDEEAEKQGKQKKGKGTPGQKPEEEEEKKLPAAKDETRGLKIDLKA